MHSDYIGSSLKANFNAFGKFNELVRVPQFWQQSLAALGQVLKCRLIRGVGKSISVAFVVFFKHDLQRLVLLFIIGTCVNYKLP